MTTIVTVSLDDSFEGVMKVYLCGQNETLAAGESACFSCVNGRRLLTVEILSQKTGVIPYRLDFVNAQRWNSNKYIKDEIFRGEPKSYYIYIPGVSS